MFGLLRQSRLLIVPILAIDYLCHQMVCKCHAPTGNRLSRVGSRVGQHLDGPVVRSTPEAQFLSLL